MKKTALWKDSYGPRAARPLDGMHSRASKHAYLPVFYGLRSRNRGYIDLQVLTADPHRADTSRPHTTRLRCNNRGGERRGATGGGGGEGGDEWGREGGG